MKNAVLLIDFQNDFCSPNGSLYIPGAEKDCERTAMFLRNNLKNISQIHATMDCHQYFHIAHPSFWKTGDDGEVPAGTIITYEDFSSGRFKPAVEALRPRVEEYLISLEGFGRYQLTIWPIHCLIGSFGFSINEEILKAANEWELMNIGNVVDFVIKSRNPLTEHYSAIHAEVPDPFDFTTRTNFKLIDSLKNMDKIYVAGEALSHCVANTLRDLFIYIPIQKFVLLTDCTTTIPEYVKTSEKFLEQYQQLGLSVAKSTITI